MKEFKSTDEALNEFYNNLYMVTGDTTGEHLFAIGFLNGAVAYAYVANKISYEEYLRLLDTIQEMFHDEN